jgi:cyanophycinase
MKFKGTLIPIGGNEDKGIIKSEIYTLEYITNGILARVVKESGGNAAHIVVIPTASSIPDEVIDNYQSAFATLGCSNVYIVDIRQREQSELPSYIDLIKKADCVMFSGGDQSKITKIIGGTTIHKILLDRLQNDQIVIAGTSAGAMCMSDEMITGGSSSESFYKGAVGMDKGMGFISNVIIDSHFIRRGRFGRLAEAVAYFPHLIGVGLSEDTGLVIKDCNHFEVIGSGMIIIFDPNNLKHNNIDILEEGTPITLTNLTTHVLANGDQFDIDRRKVKVLPMEASFS